MTRKHLVISSDEMRSALERMAELAVAEGVDLRLHITGGTVMMLEFNTRPIGTNDCDALRAEPANKAVEYARRVASERGWPDSWLNTKAAIFEREAKAPDHEAREIWKIPGLTITRPSLIRLLAWKLDRYADSVDRGDALVLLKAILGTTPYTKEVLALALEAHLPRKDVQLAIENLDDLWDGLAND